MTIVGESFRSESLSPDQYRKIVEYAIEITSDIATNGAKGFEAFIESQKRVQELSDDGPREDNRITPIQAEGNRLFAMSVFAYLENLDVDSEDDKRAFRNIGEGFFFVSPNITNYVGGINRQIELLAFAQRSPFGRRMSDRVDGEIIYHGAFSENVDQVFISGLDGQPSLEAKIAYLGTINRLARHSLDQSWSEPFYRAVLEVNRYVDETDQHPMLKVTSDEFAYETDMAYTQSRVFYDDYSATDDELAPFIAEAEERQRQEEAALRVEYPLLPDWQRPVRVANDACAGMDRGVIDSLYTRDGSVVPISGAMDGSSITREQAALLGTLYHDSIRRDVGDQLGIKLTELALGEQLRLLEYMSATNTIDFRRLQEVIKNAADPFETAKAFLATEFGQDYGDSILTIAEKVPAEQARHIFETVNGFREHTHEFASWFRDYDPEFARATELSMNESLTDILCSIEQLAHDGELHIDVAPYRKGEGYIKDSRYMCNVDSLGAGVEIISALGKGMELVPGVIAAPDVIVARVNEDDEQFVIYRFTSRAVGTLLLHIRPEAAYGYDKDYEYGNKSGVEASIKFVVNPTDPHHLRADKDPDGLSFRFDREGRLVTESPFSADRDPTRVDGTMSVDISACAGDPSRMPVRIGRFIAAGNRLRADRIGSDDTLHHNTHFFDQERYGKAGGFAKLAVYCAHMAEAMIYLQKHGSHASRYRSLPGILQLTSEKSAA